MTASDFQKCCRKFRIRPREILSNDLTPPVLQTDEVQQAEVAKRLLDASDGKRQPGQLWAAAREAADAYLIRNRFAESWLAMRFAHATGIRRGPMLFVMANLMLHVRSDDLEDRATLRALGCLIEEIEALPNLPAEGRQRLARIRFHAALGNIAARFEELYGAMQGCLDRRLDPHNQPEPDLPANRWRQIRWLRQNARDKRASDTEFAKALLAGDRLGELTYDIDQIDWMRRSFPDRFTPSQSDTIAALVEQADALLTPFPTDQVQRILDRGKSTVIAVAHTPFMWSSAQALGCSVLPSRILARGAVMCRGIRHDPAQMHDTAQFGLQGFARFAQTRPEQPVALMMAPDGSEGTKRTATELTFQGRTLHLPKGAEKIGASWGAVMAFATIRWVDGRLRHELVEGPDMGADADPAALQDRWRRFYLDQLARSFETEAESLGAVTIAWKTPPDWFEAKA